MTLTTLARAMVFCLGDVYFFEKRNLQLEEIESLHPEETEKSEEEAYASKRM